MDFATDCAVSFRDFLDFDALRFERFNLGDEVHSCVQVDGVGGAFSTGQPCVKVEFG